MSFTARADMSTGILRHHDAATLGVSQLTHTALFSANRSDFHTRNVHNRRIRAHANKSVTDSLGASFVASGAQPSLFGTIWLYTTGRSQTHSVVAIR